MAVRKIEFILGPLALKKGAKYEQGKQEGEAYAGEPECPPCRIRYGAGGKK